MIENVLNYIGIDDLIATSGQPVPGEIKQIAHAAYEVIINLAVPDSEGALKDEGALVANTGMRYIHIPVSWEEPTMKDLECFFDVMQMCVKKKVWIHCAKNMRVSCFVYLYRKFLQSIPEEEAAAPMFALWNPDDYPAWKELIEAAEVHFKYRSANTCDGMEAIRKGIDALDREMIVSLGKRAGYVHRAARYKTDASAVHARERQESMIVKRREWAEAEGLDADMIEEMYRNLVKRFIDQEMKAWEKQ